MPLPDGWTLSASAFNLTPEVIRAERSAPELVLSMRDDDLADVLEVELGQMWRSYPTPSESEANQLRDELSRRGGRVSIVGVSIDEWARADRRRDDDERYDFLVPQLRAAAALGATGIRLPIGQAGPTLLRRVLPLLQELDLVLFEEAQGDQTPQNPANAPHYEDIARLDDPHVRLLLDISMLMPALPVTYLEELERGGISPDLVALLRDEWRDPSTNEAVVAALRAGAVPETVHTLFMNLLVRFGRSDVTAVEGVLPLLSGVHLKFWDLDDADGRVTKPIADLARALARSGYRGTLCSEWGGQEWLDDDPWDITRRHLSLAHHTLTSAMTTFEEGAA